MSASGNLVEDADGIGVGVLDALAHVGGCSVWEELVDLVLDGIIIQI